MTLCYVCVESFTRYFELKNFFYQELFLFHNTVNWSFYVVCADLILKIYLRTVKNSLKVIENSELLTIQANNIWLERMKRFDPSLPY